MDGQAGAVVLMGKSLRTDKGQADEREAPALHREAWLIGLGLALSAVLVISLIL